MLVIPKKVRDEEPWRSCGTSPLKPMKRKASVKAWRTWKMEKSGLSVSFSQTFEVRNGRPDQALAVS